MASQNSCQDNMHLAKNVWHGIQLQTDVLYCVKQALLTAKNGLLKPLLGYRMGLHLQGLPHIIERIVCYFFNKVTAII